MKDDFAMGMSWGIIIAIILLGGLAIFHVFGVI